MNRLMLIKIGTLLALLLAVTWSIAAPSFEPIITSVTLLVAAITLFTRNTNPDYEPDQQDSVNLGEKKEIIVFDAKTFPRATKESITIKYDSRIKLWEILEYAVECVPSAIPSNYGMAWVYQNAKTGEIYSNLGSYAKEKGYLEEEAKSLLHIGLGPETTLKIVKPNRK